MLTNTHILVAATVLTRRRFTTKQNLAIIAGGVFPDLSVFVMAAVGRMPGSTITNLWRKPDGMYWQEPWQFLSALSNSIPLYVVLLLLFMFLVRRAQDRKALWLGCALFLAACLLHVLFDFPLHADDAHAHFWPLTGARFHSPVSYWQSQYWGNWVSAIEVMGGLIMAAILWRRFGHWRPRIGTALLAVPYIAAIAFLLRGFVS